MVFERIMELCKEKGINVHALEMKLGFGNATIRRWATSSPKVDSIKKVADFFGVSVDYLCGREGRSE